MNFYKRTDAHKIKDQIIIIPVLSSSIKISELELHVLLHLSIICAPPIFTLSADDEEHLRNTFLLLFFFFFKLCLL